MHVFVRILFSTYASMRACVHVSWLVRARVHVSWLVRARVCVRASTCPCEFALRAGVVWFSGIEAKGNNQTSYNKLIYYLLR